MPRPQYDVQQILLQFLQGKLAERPALMREIMRELRMSKPLIVLIKEIASGVEAKNLSPVQTIHLSIIYGCVLGILMEKERSQRTRIVQ